jgi:hypothetical protein
MGLSEWQTAMMHLVINRRARAGQAQHLSDCPLDEDVAPPTYVQAWDGYFA